ncbi:MAG: pyrroline-5-carboxylate reductase [Lysobacterales bacterium CG17_big_fil_post_rev_8_21_14_2_50_64_11]|nr:MAG: pyrroline-5-carboxylate reductase [Xanthomonadales bacterium CG17_big_fil_post_rev_8_21_14_2_50_64_11]PIX59364.1 MAG: pyrroline-5-carboxylate reductase [Xanthomonadales bacterium CG_4_10_14_3_um_filter_64_11]
MTKRETTPLHHDPIIAFIGGGNMARSLIGGLLARGTTAASIRAADPNAESRSSLSHDFGIQADADNTAAADGAAIWVLAVKPQVMATVCASLRALAQAQRPTIVSIAAGITSTQIDGWLGGEQAIVRCMPNTPALLGAGATGVCANARVGDAARAQVMALLAAVGISVAIEDEALMDAVTAVSGSGPAYVFLLAEAWQAAAQAQGLTADAARALVNQTILGAARMLLESDAPATTLRQRVTSPGGTTHAAITQMQGDGFAALIARAIDAATRRGAELAAAASV